jgi:hypothetical protein
MAGFGIRAFALKFVSFISASRPPVPTVVNLKIRFTLMRLLNVFAASAMAASLMGGYAMADSGQATPVLWNGQENSLGANSAGGGNRYAHTAPVPAATSTVPSNMWNGEENTLGANSAGGGNRSAHLTPVPAATGSAVVTPWNGDVSLGANSAGGGNRY